MVLSFVVSSLLLCPSSAPGQHRRLDPSRLPAETLPTPERRDDVGNSSMPISTSSPEAQRWFDQGLNLLHCFWDFEAYRAFRAAARSDPQAAMAYWGLFMSLGYNPTEQSQARSEALERARALAPRATPRERLYIEAAATLEEHQGRAAQTAYVAAMEHLVASYPDDLQAKLLLARFLVVDSGGVYSQPDRPGIHSPFERSEELLEPLLQTHPQNAGLHHYWIHTHEVGPRPEKALESARKLPQLAPGAGHTLHMPGHLYFQLGDYEKAYDAFQQALRFDRSYMERTGVEAVDNWSYSHNLEYLVANCSEDGRYREGLRYARELQSQPVDLLRSEATGLGYLVYGGRTAAARLDFRYGRWGPAAAALQQGLEEWRFASQVSADYVGGLLEYALTMDAAEKGDLAKAAARLQRLSQIGVRLTTEQAGFGSDWYFEAAKRVLAIATIEAAATLLSVQGQHDQAVEQMQRASRMEAVLGYGEPPLYARPIAESLGSIHLRAERWSEARAAYQTALVSRPDSGHPWIGIARSWAGAGDTRNAQAAYRRFLALWRHADEDLPQVREARAWLEEHP
jgi:tetratricopeptide (TPR) repeat protein